MLDFSYYLTFTNIHRPDTLVAELADTTMEGVRPVFLRSFARFLAQEEYRFCAEGNGISAALTAADAAIWAEFTRSLGLREGALDGINYADLEARVVASMGRSATEDTPLRLADTMYGHAGFYRHRATLWGTGRAPTGLLSTMVEAPHSIHARDTTNAYLFNTIYDGRYCPQSDAVPSPKKTWSKRYKHIGKNPKGKGKGKPNKRRTSPLRKC